MSLLILFRVRWTYAPHPDADFTYNAADTFTYNGDGNWTYGG